MAIWIVRSPDTGLLLLVFFVYLNLSQILVRFHGLPSVLQLLGLPLLVSAAVLRGGRLSPIILNPVTLLFASFFLIALLSTNYAWDRELADARSVELAKGFIIFLLTAMLVDSPGRLRRALWVIIGAGSFLAVLGLYQVGSANFADSFGGLARIKNAQIYADVFEPRIAGPVGDPNFFAQMLLILVPLALFMAWTTARPWLRWAAYLAATTLAAATIMTYSRGGALALAVVVTLSLLARGLRWRNGLIAVAVVGAVVALAPSEFSSRLTTLQQLLPGYDTPTLHPDSSFEERRLVTRTAWRMFLDHPVAGVGAANYPARFDEYSDQVGSDAREYDEPADPEYPHSLYLETAAELGLIGFLTFMALVVAVLWSLHRARRNLAASGDPVTAALARGIQIAVFGYLIAGLFLHGHFLRYLWLLFGLAVAICALAVPMAQASSRQSHAS